MTESRTDLTGLTRREAEELIRFAREKKLFLMEAMWTRFLPLMSKFKETLAAGVIGTDTQPRSMGVPSHRLPKRE